MFYLKSNNKIKLCAMIYVILTLFSQQTFACTYIECENHRPFNEYEKIDKTFNSTYHKLINMLDKEQIKQLRAIQRSWIQHRDQECDELESSWCDSGVCETFSQSISAANERLTCLISTTEQRNKQFSSAIHAIKNHKTPDFRFENTP